MHKGVLRDIAKEKEEERQVSAAAAAAAVALAGALPADPGARACEGDICDLAQTRFRDPATGRVYVPAVPAGAAALR